MSEQPSNPATQLLNVKLSELIQFQKLSTAMAFNDLPIPSLYRQLSTSSSVKKVTTNDFTRLPAKGLFFVADIDDAIRETQIQLVNSKKE